MIDTVSWNWDRVSDPFWTQPPEEVFFLLHRWKEMGRHRLLDLGCGLGRHSLLFAQRGFNVTSLDLSPSGLRKLGEAVHETDLPILTVLGDVRSLPFEDGSFDAVLSYHSIYHVDSDGMIAAIRELGRVLRPGGEVYLTFISKNTPSFTDSTCRTIDGNVRLKQEEDGSTIPHYFSDANDIQRLLADFDIIRLCHIQDIYDGKSSWHYFVHASLSQQCL